MLYAKIRLKKHLWRQLAHAVAGIIVVADWGRDGAPCMGWGSLNKIQSHRWLQKIKTALIETQPGRRRRVI